MSNYTFSTLNDKEFEHIVRDLLTLKLSLPLQAFRVGKDKGVDLRYSTPKNNNAIVVQVKHFVASTFSQLKHKLKSSELPKVVLLSPEQYIVATSLSLTAGQKDELKCILEPYLLTSNDVFGQEDLNGLLLEYPDIEKKYFKLWFSSVNIFESILNNAIEGRTRYLLEKISRKLPFYVITKKLDEAEKILKEKKLLLITGQPGIGKTTMAEALIMDRAKMGYKIYQVENIKEAEIVLSSNTDQKQLFYFDDFLGGNYLEIINAHRTETQLTNFVDRVRYTPNKYLVLTTRTVILNHAVERHEKIYLSKMGNDQFEVKLTDYTRYEKALILYNHLYFNKVNAKFYDSILEEKFYRTIIQHKNYTPRIMEFITDNTKISQLTTEGYHQFIMNNLNNPSEIWRYSYNNQIGYLDRCLLLTLFTFEKTAYENILLQAFEERLSYEREVHNQVIAGNQFQDSVKILLNGFILSSLHTTTTPPIREYSFINPSLVDFFMGYVSESYSERKGIVSSMIFVEQLDRFNPERGVIPLEKDLQLIIRDKIANGKLRVLNRTGETFSESRVRAIFLQVLCKYCAAVNIDNLLYEYFKRIPFSESWASFFYEIDYFLLAVGDAPMTEGYIKANFIDIVENYMCSIYSFGRASKIRKLFVKYGYDFDEYAKSEKGVENLRSVIDNVLQSEEGDIQDRMSEITDLDEVEQAYDEISSTEELLLDEFFPNTSVEYDSQVEFDKEYWKEKVHENSLRADDEAARSEDYDFDHFREEKYEAYNEDNAIDELFSKPDD